MTRAMAVARLSSGRGRASAKRSLLAAAIILAAAPLTAQDTVTATISGAVYDSIGKHALAGALVQIVRRDAPSVSRTVTTDSSGRYSFPAVPVGEWLVGFYHRSLEDLSLDTPLLGVIVRDSTPIRAMLAIPSANTLIRNVCGDEADSTGLWIGRILSAENGGIIPGATVVAEWSTLNVVGNQVQRNLSNLRGESSRDGLFAMCALPSDDIVVSRAWSGSDSSGTITFTLPAERLLTRDIYISTDPANHVLVAAAADSVPPVARGPGTIRGRVTRKGGVPLSNARLMFWETGSEVITSSDGHYQLDSLPLGSATLEARALGFLPVSRIVDVRGDRPASADFLLESRATYLDTVKVIGTRVYDSPQYRGFLDRQKRGFGHFLDEEAVERRHAVYMTDYFRMIPGVNVFPGSFGGRIVMRGMGLSAYCNPAVFLDGMRMVNVAEAGFESFVSPMDVRAIEVYTRGSSVPAEFMNLDGCGSIVIWTGQRKVNLPP